MKKNLNIAYLNGAEGMIRRGANEGSGESGGGTGSSDGVKWEYYKIEWSNSSYDYYAMWNVFIYVTLVNEKIDGIVYIMPRGQGWSNTAAIAGISVKNIAKGTVVETGSWLNDVKELDKLWGNNFDYSFLKPITEEEFYSDNFDYPAEEG